MKNKDIAEFYDDFVDKLLFDKRIGHARYIFIENLAKEKVRADMSALDLGCGIGTTTAILSNIAKSVIGVDISGELIKHAKNTNPAKNIDYVCADITTINLMRQFDFIGIFDVLEHIKTSQVNDLFGVLKSHLLPHGTVHGVIPYWQYLDKKRKHHPETMQVIDNSIQLSNIMEWANLKSLEITAWNVMSLFNENDYVYLSLSNE